MRRLKLIDFLILLINFSVHSNGSETTVVNFLFGSTNTGITIFLMIIIIINNNFVK
jgi:hypothetical protein